jgi:type II secretory pathway pseudopilin PulG
MRIGRGKAGYTLVELVLVSLLVGIIGSLGLSGLVKTGEGFREMESRTAVLERGRTAMARMRRTIRMGRFDTGTTTATATSLAFPDQDQATVTFTLSGGDLTEDGNALATGVSGLSFAYYDAANTELATFPLSSEDVDALHRIVVAYTVTVGEVSRAFHGTVFLRCRDTGW